MFQTVIINQIVIINQTTLSLTNMYLLNAWHSCLYVFPFSAHTGPLLLLHLIRLRPANMNLKIGLYCQFLSCRSLQENYISLNDSDFDKKDYICRVLNTLKFRCFQKQNEKADWHIYYHYFLIHDFSPDLWEEHNVTRPTGVTSAWTTFSEVSDALVFCVVFCGSLFVLFVFAIVYPSIYGFRFFVSTNFSL